MESRGDLVGNELSAGVQPPKKTNNERRVVETGARAGAVLQ